MTETTSQDRQVVDTRAGEPRFEFDLREYLRIILKNRWRILILTTLVTALAAFHAFRQVPVFSATATLLIEREAARFVSIDDVYGYSSMAWEYYETQYAILRSRPIAERVVDKLNLVSNETADSPASQPSSAAGWRRFLPLFAKQKPSPPPNYEQRRQAAIGGIAGSAIITPIRNSQLVRITFHNTDPEAAAARANALAEAYIEENLEGRLDMATRATSWLSERAESLEQSLNQSEQNLQSFREQERLLDLRGVDSLAVQQVNTITAQLTQARSRVAEIRSQANQLGNAVNMTSEQLLAVPGILSYPLIETLRTEQVAAERRVEELSNRYGPRHPTMIAAQSDLATAETSLLRQLRVVAEGVASELRAAQTEVGVLERELNSAKNEVQAINRKTYDLQALEREVETNRQLYDMFQTRLKETDATRDLSTANARVVEFAQVPKSPFKPNRKRIITIAFLLALAASIGLAFLLDYLDNTLKDAEDVERKLGLPVLGMLPQLKTSGRKDIAPLQHFDQNHQSNFSEAVRTIRTNLLLSSLDDPVHTLLVTSSVPGEGKTTMSINLAHALGRLKSVLLIDADMRRPMVGRALATAEYGLSHFIAGEAEIDECMSPVADTNVRVMSAGIIPSNPLELLSSQRFRDTLTQLRNRFDHIIIDCAPTLAVSDALVLSRLVDGVIYMVKSDATPFQAAQAGIRRLQRVDARLLGVIVNRVFPRAGYYGRYAYYGDYYYAYQYGYGDKGARS